MMKLNTFFILLSFLVSDSSAMVEDSGTPNFLRQNTRSEQIDFFKSWALIQKSRLEIGLKPVFDRDHTGQFLYYYGFSFIKASHDASRKFIVGVSVKIQHEEMRYHKSSSLRQEMHLSVTAKDGRVVCHDYRPDLHTYHPPQDPLRIALSKIYTALKNPEAKIVVGIEEIQNYRDDRDSIFELPPPQTLRSLIEFAEQKVQQICEPNSNAQEG